MMFFILQYMPYDNIVIWHMACGIYVIIISSYSIIIIIIILHTSSYDNHHIIIHSRTNDIFSKRMELMVMSYHILVII